MPGASASMSCPQMALFSASQRCVRQRQAGARLAGEGGAWAASDVAPDQRTRLVTMRLREGRGSTHLARFLLAEEEDDEVSDGPGEERGWRQGENEWTISRVFRLSFRWFPSLLAPRCPSPFRRPSGAGLGRRHTVCLFIRLLVW